MTDMTDRKQASHRDAFTLIELLVVIAIIAILAAILFPVFAQARKKAYQATGTSNAKQLSLAILQYVQDYDERFPRAGRDCQSDSNGNPNQCGSNTWQNVLQPYIKNGGVFRSPGDASVSIPAGAMQPNDGNLTLLYNDMLSHQTGVDANGYSDGNEDIPAVGISLAGVNAPADCIALAEGHGGWDKISGNGIDPKTIGPDWTGSTDIHNKWHLESDLSTKATFEIAGTNYGGGWGVNMAGLPLYNGGSVVAFTDGHVKYTRMTDSKGHPIICSTLPWEKAMDPVQRNADKDGCSDPNNLPGVSGGNWL